jgi:hypothetical protein
VTRNDTEIRMVSCLVKRKKKQIGKA